MTKWALVYEGYDPGEEGLREALCTLGNGYFATRGAAPESGADGIHYPGTYLACCYNRLTTEIAGRAVENEDLVNLPNWLPLTFRIGKGRWFSLDAVEILSFRQELDLGKGILFRHVRFHDRRGRETLLENLRLVHMADRHLAAQKTRITALNWSGVLEIRSALDGRVVNAGVERYKAFRNRHLEILEAGDTDGETAFLKVRTGQSNIRIAMAVRTRAFRSGLPLSPVQTVFPGRGLIEHRLKVELKEGEEIIVEKICSLYSSRDYGISECGIEARRAAARAGSFDELLGTHVLAWEQLWRRFEIEYESRDGHPADRTGMILCLYTFHLLQTTSLHSRDLDVGVPSRGWHGEAYRGHVFWDELFIFPFLNLRIPEITRSLLLYRYRRLNEARLAAREAGFQGAMFPWQSGSNGREESQEVHLNPRSGRWIPDHSRLQRHVNAAIAYNVWQYYQVTGDMEFMSFHGAEMFLAIARFWASIAVYDETEGRYGIFGVMGPDEYHDAYPGAEKPGVDNNAYTNMMVSWILHQAGHLLDILPDQDVREICEKIGLGRDEIQEWDEISRKMKIPFHGNGIISQFDRYDELEEFDWRGYRRRYGDIQRLDRILEAEGDTTNRYKVSKQADVLMLFYLFSSEQLGEIFARLGYPFRFETIPGNIDYYLHRTSHGSTLSRVVHSWVLARSDRHRSWSLFQEALQSDISDIQGGTTREGIHLGAMAGCVDILQRAYTGIETTGGVLRFNPCLPEEMKRMHLHLRYRGHTLEVDIEPGRLQIRTVRSNAKPILVSFRDEVCELRMDRPHEFVW